MILRDFIKVADFTSDYAALSVYDPTGMIEVGYFNSFYKLNPDNPVLDYEVIRIKGNFFVTIQIDEKTAKQLSAENKKFRDDLYGKRRLKK